MQVSADNQKKKAVTKREDTPPKKKAETERQSLSLKQQKPEDTQKLQKVSKIEQKPLQKTEPIQTIKPVEKPEPTKRSENRMPDSRRDSFPSKRESVSVKKQEPPKPKHLKIEKKQSIDTTRDQANTMRKNAVVAA